MVEGMSVVVNVMLSLINVMSPPPLCIGFIDFKKAFDNIHHNTLWKILRHYGRP